MVKTQGRQKRSHELTARSRRQSSTTAAKSSGFLHEMPCISRIQAVQRQQDRQVGGVEIRVPGRFATDVGAQAQVALDQRRQQGRGDAFQLIQRQRAAREDMQFDRSQMLFADRMPDA